METRFVTIKDGEPSMATPFSEVFIASVDLFAGALVSPDGANTVTLATSSGAVAIPFGFVEKPALAGHPVIVYFFGKFTPVFANVPDNGGFLAPMYLGPDGEVSSIPSSGFIQQVGVFWPATSGYQAMFCPQLFILSL
jgi:hypothetical protein